MADLVDLHLHSSFSDGALAPAQLVARAGEAAGPILAAAELVEEANARLEEAVEVLGGPLEHHHHRHDHPHD